MFTWLKKKYTEYMLKHHISKQSCFVFPIIPKKMLQDGVLYETFDFGTRYSKYFNETYTDTISINMAKWNAEKDCFIGGSKIISYEDFKPIKETSFYSQEPYNYGICSYNPCDVNALDIEQLKDIIFNIGDDTMVESDDIWEKLIDYLDKRGLSY